MRFGICCGPGSFVKEIKEAQPLSELPSLLESVHAAGADYVEFPVGSVLPDADESEFGKVLELVRRSPIKVEAFNSFIPAKLPITGPNVDSAAVLKFCRVALRRCKTLGGEVVVLGSAGARKVPEGFDMARAEAQFLDFCRALAPLAQDAGILIAIEPLNHEDDNLCISIAHGLRLVEAVGHPSVQLLADYFHMLVEREDLAVLPKAGAYLRHTHVADFGRVAPGFAPEGEADFLNFFRNLRKAGYDGRCSFEGSFKDIHAQTRPMLALLRRRWAEAAN